MAVKWFNSLDTNSSHLACIVVSFCPDQHSQERMKCNKVKNWLRPYCVICIHVSSVCSAAVCDRANEFLQKSEGDMRHKKTVTGWLRLQNCKNWGFRLGLYNKNLSEWIWKLVKLSKLNLELRDIRDVEKKTYFSELFRFRVPMKIKVHKLHQLN